MDYENDNEFIDNKKTELKVKLGMFKNSLSEFRREYEKR